MRGLLTELAEFEPTAIFLPKSLSERYSRIPTKSEMDESIDVALKHLGKSLLIASEGAEQPTQRAVTTMLNTAVAAGVLNALTRSRRPDRCLCLVPEHFPPRPLIVFALRYFGHRPATAIATVMQLKPDIIEGWIAAAQHCSSSTSREPGKSAGKRGRHG